MFDVAVIGSGPGGYVAAIRAAQHGMKVICIEKERTFGGTCLNIGCIPSKTLLHATEIYSRIKHHGQDYGIETNDIRINLDKMMARKEETVEGLIRGISFLFQKHHVTTIQGEATLINPHQIQVGLDIIEASSIILATGSEPIPLPFLPFDEKKILSSTGALSLNEIPKKMAIVGAGIIGLELGSVYRRLGCEIQVIELLDRIVPNLDREISKSVQQILQKQGFSFQLNTKITGGQLQNNSVILSLEDKPEISAEVALIAIGRRPYSNKLGLEKLNIRLEKGRVVIDQNFRSSIPNIYAIGDLVDGPMLAHKASEEGTAVADILAGESAHLNYSTIPNVMYTWPEVASVGLTEDEAHQAQLPLLVGKFPFKANPRAQCSGDVEGFVKILAEKQSQRIIGLHIIGPHASEMIQEGVVAMNTKMTVKDLAYASHAHPTYSEAIKEAALQSIHFL